MTRVKIEEYKVEYQQLYAFLRGKHPEILKEYQEYLKEVRRKVEEALLEKWRKHY